MQDGLNRAALQADESGMRHVSEKPLIIFFDETEHCLTIHEGFVERGFETVIAADLEEVLGYVHEYDDQDLPKGKTVVFVNPKAKKLKGQIWLITHLDKTVYNRVISYVLAPNIDDDLRERALTCGAIWSFDSAIDSVRTMALYANHPKIWDPRLSYETDFLTKFPTRGAFEKAALGELAAAHRNKQPARISLIIFDGDKFKEINDEFGHDTGDKVLIAMADSIRSGCRLYDHYCRAGGDEFKLLIVNPQEGETAEIADRIAKDLKSKTIEAGPGKYVHARVSYGWSEVTWDQIESPEATLLKLHLEADVEMYAAKPAKRRRRRG